MRARRENTPSEVKRFTNPPVVPWPSSKDLYAKKIHFKCGFPIHLYLLGLDHCSDLKNVNICKAKIGSGGRSNTASVRVSWKRGVFVCLQSGHITEGVAFSLKRHIRNSSILSIIIPKSSALDPMPI